jgi:hypothetical protein
MQFFASDVCLRGYSGRWRHNPKESAISHKETFAGIEIPSAQGLESTQGSYAFQKRVYLLASFGI